MATDFYELIGKQGTVFLPDIGTFFNDDKVLAKKMIDSLAAAKIPVIKGEILHNANICLRSDFDEGYYSSEKDLVITENYRQLIERKVISLDTYANIFDYARRLGCKLALSVYDNEGVDFAIEQDAVLLKVASSNITHIPLIEYIAKTDKTIIVDTGHSTVEEIARAINVLNDAGKTDIIIQHSPPAPPVPVEEQNLRFMQTLGNAFGIPYGLSDHHNSEEMLYAATTMGAVVVEKGVCPDGLGDEQDRAHALNISEAAIVQKKISNIAKGLGNGIRMLNRDRAKYRSRMCLYAREDIHVGETLTETNTGYAFPLLGVGVEYIEQVLGRTASQKIRKGQPINWSDL